MIMRKIILAAVIAIIIALTVIFAFMNTKSTQSNQNLTVEILAENLDTPWAIDFLPDDTLIFTERQGRVSIIEAGRVKLIGEINVNEESESGLLGIAVDPEFEENYFIYIYYTYEKGNRVSRFTFNQKEKKLENELILLENIPNAKYHDGGRIKFGQDEKLYITTGDATEPSSAQDPNSLAGKILRMNKNGSIPEDNPFKNYAYSYGHRNPQGIAWHPITRELYASEHGPTRNDELNLIQKGKNYGWPDQECTEQGEYENPLRCFSEFTLAPSGIAFLEEDLYIAGLRGSQLRKLTFEKDYKKILQEEEIFSNLGRMREVVEHKGYLYIATNNRDGRGIPRSRDDKIIRVKP